jgi:fructose-specific component phosphotransferase system IIB-like protein
MAIKLERLPGESIFVAEIATPVNSEDVPSMFQQMIPMRLAIRGKLVLILDFTKALDHPESFGLMSLAMAQASRGIRVSRDVGVDGPPITIYVGTGPIVAIASEAMEQDQYGGVRGQLCASRDEAITLARTLLAS